MKRSEAQNFFVATHIGLVGLSCISEILLTDTSNNPLGENRRLDLKDFRFNLGISENELERDEVELEEVSESESKFDLDLRKHLQDLLCLTMHAMVEQKKISSVSLIILLNNHNCSALKLKQFYNYISNTSP